MELLYEEKKDGPRILFYADYNPSNSLLRSYFAAIYKRLIENQVVRRFRRIELVFRVNSEFERDFFKGINKALAKSENAYVVLSDVYRGKNRAFINEDGIYASEYERKWNEHGGMTKIPQRQRDDVLHSISKQAALDCIGVIVHEITHLWQLRIDKTKKIIKRYHKKIIRCMKSMLQNAKLFKGNDALAIHWTVLRKHVLLILDYISTEGIARFFQEMEKGTIEYSEQSLRKTYADAYRHCIDLNKKLGNLYSRFMHMIKVQHNISNTEFDNIAAELWEISETIPDYGYLIGMHVYHWVSNAAENLSLQDLAQVPYHKLIGYYETFCDHIGWQPVVSLHSKKGVFSYKKHVKMLTQLRKETEHIVVWK